MRRLPRSSGTVLIDKDSYIALQLNSIGASAARPMKFTPFLEYTRSPGNSIYEEHHEIQGVDHYAGTSLGLNEFCVK